MNIEDLNKKQPEFNLKGLLRKMGHINDIIEASSDDIKIAEETEKVILNDSKYKGLEDNLIKAVPGYLSAPIFLDDFENHSDRRLWRREMANHSMEIYHFYDRNKIANHSMRNFFSMFKLLSQVEEIDPKLKEEILEIEEKVTPSTPKYDSLSEKEKLEIVDSLTALARQVCNEIIK